MKYLPFIILIFFFPVLLMTACYDDDDSDLSTACSGAVAAGDSFVLDGNAVTVLELHSDLWCSCCEFCNCFAAPLAILLVEGDTVRVGGVHMSPTMEPQTGEYEGRTITMDELEDGTCEDPLDREDIQACFSIQ